MFLRLGFTAIVRGAMIPNELEIYCLVCSVAVPVSATNVFSGKMALKISSFEKAGLKCFLQRKFYEKGS